jgi:hypothetical protein
VGCADLLGSTTVPALAGVNAKILQDENSAPSSMQSIAQQQYGAEDCVWDGEYTGVGTSTGAYLSVSIAPDAKAAFESQFSELMATTTGPPHPAATENVAGDRSGYWCATDLDILGADHPSLTCDAEMLVAGYWVGLAIGNVSGRTRAQLTDGLTTALGHISSELKTAGDPPLQWVSPATAPPASCTASAAAVYAQTVGLDGNDFSCDWSSGTYGSQHYELLAGGSWALSKLDPIPPADAIYGTNPYVPLTIPGVASARVSCGDGTCDAFLAVGTSAVEIVYNDPGAARNPALLAALAAAIAAS